MDHLPARLEFQTWPERVTGAVGSGAADGVLEDDGLKQARRERLHAMPT